jgi:hypothetical protein
VGPAALEIKAGAGVRVILKAGGRYVEVSVDPGFIQRIVREAMLKGE